MPGPAAAEAEAEAAATVEIARDLAALTWQTKSVSRECLDVALQFPDENWNWSVLTWTFPEPEIIRAHINKPWDFRKMTWKGCVPLVFEFPDKDWDWDSMCKMILI